VNHPAPGLPPGHPRVRQQASSSPTCRPASTRRRFSS